MEAMVAHSSSINAERDVPYDSPGRKSRKGVLFAMITKQAPAKVNLFLNVLGKRIDGYHDMEMINARIDLTDDLMVEESSLPGVIIESNDAFLENNDNLIAQIARSMLEIHRPGSGLHIKIYKRIPAGAGLAGNSADGAALIEALNELWKLGLSKAEMQIYGLRFGADLPYCFEPGVCLVEGIGDRITPLRSTLAGKPCLVVTPSAYVSTKTIFDQGDLFGYRTKPIEAMLYAIETADWQAIKHLVHNSFAPITLAASPETAQAYVSLKAKFGEKGLFMTGTGSTWIVLLDHVNESIFAFCDEFKNVFHASVQFFL
jgi:4-diphosphocytidyl-2-C-methyl-D-erythritol kinase